MTAGAARDSRWRRDRRRRLQRSHFWPTSVQRVHCGQIRTLAAGAADKSRAAMTSTTAVTGAVVTSHRTSCASADMASTRRRERLPLLQRVRHGIDLSRG